MDCPRHRIFISRDAIVAEALAYALRDTAFDYVPAECLSEYAKLASFTPRCEWDGKVPIWMDVDSDCEYDDAGRLVLAPVMASGLVILDGDTIRMADGRSLDELLAFLDTEGVTLEDDVPFVSKRRDFLTHALAVRRLGTKAIGPVDIPMDRPLVLMDIDDCLNVAGDSDGAADELDDVPAGDRYEIDMRETISFSKELIGTRSSFGIMVPSSMSVRWSSELAHDIERLHAETGATFVWMSSWMELSKCFEETLWPDGGAPFIGYLPWFVRGFSDDGRHGKALSVSGLFTIDENHDDPSCDDIPCLVVIDDKGRPEWDGSDVFHNAVRGAVPELTIAPDRRYGITRTDWHAVCEFLRGHMMP